MVTPIGDDLTNTEDHAGEIDIATNVGELCERFPRTRDHFREVCVLLFFRRGKTPTANKLYQLFHKGSVSAPTEALSQSWKKHCANVPASRSSGRIAQADGSWRLGGDLVATVWKIGGPSLGSRMNICSGPSALDCLEDPSFHRAITSHNLYYVKYGLCRTEHNERV